MIEIAHDDLETVVFWTEQVLSRNLHILELDERRACCSRVARLQLCRFDAFLPLNQQHRESLLCLAPRDKIVREHSIRDPLLRPVHNIVLAIRRFLRRRPQTRHIGACKRLRNSQTHLFLPREHLFRNPLPDLLILHPIPHGRQTDRHARHIPILKPPRVCPHAFLPHNQVVEIVKLPPIHHTTEQLPPMQMTPRTQPHREHIVLRHPINQLLADIRAILLLLLRLRRDVPIRELPHRALQPAMALPEVRALVRRPQPQRFGVGDGAQVARLRLDDLRCLIPDGADAEGVVVFLEHLVPVEVVEGGGGVGAGDLDEHDGTAGVGVDEVGEVVDAVVDDAPEGVRAVVGGDFVAGVGLGHCEGKRMVLGMGGGLETGKLERMG